MNNSDIKYILFLISIMCFPLFMAAQETDSIPITGDLDIPDVVSIGKRPILLNKAQRLASRPTAYDSIKNPQEVNYQMIPKHMETSFEAKNIAPAKMKVKEPLQRLYQSYVKGGVGIYGPLLDFYYNQERSRKDGYGASFKHLSGIPSVKNVGPSGFSDNQLAAWNKFFLKKHAITASMSYDRNVMHHYGFNDDYYDTIQKVDIKQMYNKINGDVTLQSYHRDSSKVNHIINVGYYNLSDINQTTENNFSGNAKLSTYRDQEYYQLIVDLDINRYHYKTPITDAEIENHNAILQLSPTISTTWKDLKVKVGLSLYADISNSAKFRFYPNVEARYSLFNDIFIPYAGLNGKTIRNSLATISNENPYVLSHLNIQNTNNKLNLYGGIRGTVSSTTSFNVQAKNELFDNYAFYMNDTISSVHNQFSLAYDRLNIVTFSGEISHHIKEKLAVHGKFEYFAYNTKTLNEAFNLPKTKLTLSGSYNIKDKFITKMNLYAIGQRHFASLQTIDNETLDKTYTVKKQKAYIDGSLSFEYRYTKRISAFLQLHNFFGSKYSKWNEYPVQRFNIMGGFTYSF